MSFLNKFKKEFEGLNIGERLQSPQQAGQPAVDSQSYSAPPQSYGYGHQSQANNPHQSQQTAAEGGYYQDQHNKWSSGNQPSFEYGYQSQNQQTMHHQGGQGHGNAPQQLHQQSSPPPTYPVYQQPGLSPSPSGSPYVHQSPSPGAPVLYNSASNVSGAPGPTPPRWVPYWSEHDKRWYYVETTGRSSWEAPPEFQRLPAMPEYHGVMGQRGNAAQGSYGQMGYGHVGATPPMSPPRLDEENKKASSNTVLAAAGGFVAGGVAGYFIHDTLDKRKKKKRHGRSPGDFSDFADYPAMELDVSCNICDQTISGPYAHCAKCDHGDYDICRDCLAQGVTCEGRGKHRLVKVYPKYWCDGCDQLIRGDFYHCNICHKGDWDMCQSCLDRGSTCKADGGHQLTKLYIPPPNFGSGKHAGGSDSSSSSDSD